MFILHYPQTSSYYIILQRNKDKWKVIRLEISRYLREGKPRERAMVPQAGYR